MPMRALGPAAIAGANGIWVRASDAGAKRNLRSRQSSIVVARTGGVLGSDGRYVCRRIAAVLVFVFAHGDGIAV